MTTSGPTTLNEQYLAAYDSVAPRHVSEDHIIERAGTDEISLITNAPAPPMGAAVDPRPGHTHTFWVALYGMCMLARYQAQIGPHGELIYRRTALIDKVYHSEFGMIRFFPEPLPGFGGTGRMHSVAIDKYGKIMVARNQEANTVHVLEQNEAEDGTMSLSYCDAFGLPVSYGFIESLDVWKDILVVVKAYQDKERVAWIEGYGIEDLHPVHADSLPRIALGDRVHAICAHGEEFHSCIDPISVGPKGLHDSNGKVIHDNITGSGLVRLSNIPFAEGVKPDDELRERQAELNGCGVLTRFLFPSPGSSLIHLPPHIFRG